MATTTRGPWEAPGKDGDAWVICTAKSHGKRRTVAHAYSPEDAALIASAPAMFAALRDLRDDIAKLQWGQSYPGRNHALMDRVDAILATATDMAEA